MSDILYVDIQDMDFVFDIIREHYTSHETIPDYRHEKSGLAKLEGILMGTQEDIYYPTIRAKAGHLIIQINKGHFFSNGNKRVALASTLFFLFKNDYTLRDRSKEEYRNELVNLFPKCTDYADFGDFRPEEFGYYNLSIIIADHDKYVNSFDELKDKVNAFLKFSLVREV
jgi:death-on-curing family protein